MPVADPRDDGHLRAALLAGARKDFETILRRVARERVYAIGLYTADGAPSVGACVCTEEGLAKAVESYVDESPGVSARRLALELRDSIADSPHHRWTMKLRGLRSASALLMQRYDLVLSLVLDVSEARAESIGRAWDRRTDAVMLSVLEELDDEVIFGAGKARERVLLNLFRGDQSDRERLRFAKRLNPPRTYAAYAKYIARRR